MFGRHRHLDADEPGRVEPDVEVPELHHAPGEQASRGQQHDGRGHLAGNEDAAQRMPEPAVGNRPAALPQDRLEVASGDARGRRNRAGKSGQQPDHAREHDGAAVERGIGDSRQVRGHQRDDHRQQGTPRDDGRGRRDNREHQRFREQLTGERGRRRAERQADGELMRAAGRTDERQSRDVRARDEQ